MKPVLYLDVDDTLLSMHPSFYARLRQESGRWWGIAAPGAKEFMEYALEHFEVRWLTTWCLGWRMTPDKVRILENELGLVPGRLQHVRSTAWFGHGTGLKTGGIKWEEHVLGRRPFVWVEDDILEEEQRTLKDHGFADCWISCNVTDNPLALTEAHQELIRRFGPVPMGG